VSRQLKNAAHLKKMPVKYLNIFEDLTALQQMQADKHIYEAGVEHPIRRINHQKFVCSNFKRLGSANVDPKFRLAINFAAIKIE